MRSLTLTRRRRLYAAAAFYAASAWLLVQIATQVFPFFNVPNWSVRLIIIAVVVAFPFAMLASWFIEWAPARHGRESGADELDMLSGPATPGAAARRGEQSIAVLPFADLSEARDQEYFSDGLTEELLNLFAQLPQLRVIARTSSFSFKGKDVDVAAIARALNVATVLEGSVRKSGNRLRVTAQLIRGADHSHLWSQSYERELTDIFRVQDEIAGAVVAALKVKLLPNQLLTDRHRTTNIQAHDQHLLGQNIVRRGRFDDASSAVAAFQRAIALDPGYAAAYAGMANAQSTLADLAPTPGQRSQAKSDALSAAEKAIALAPDFAAGYVARAQLRYRLSYDWKGAEHDFHTALALDPTDGDVLALYALAMINLRRTDEAVAQIRKALDADPLSWVAWTLYGYILQRKGEAPAARSAMRRAVEISPGSSVARFVLGCLELDEGEVEIALGHFRQAGEGYRQAGIAMAEHTRGQEAESIRALEELKAKYAAGFSYQIAQVHGWRGEKDAAFEWLARAREHHDSGLARMRGDPALKALEDDPRYAALIQELGFPP